MEADPVVINQVFRLPFTVLVFSGVPAILLFGLNFDIDLQSQNGISPESPSPHQFFAFGMVIHLLIIARWQRMAPAAI